MPEHLSFDDPGPLIDYEFFFRHSKDLFCIAGFDGYFKKVNQAVVEVLGYTEEELFSRPINSFVFEEDRQLTEERRENLRNAVPLLNFENRYMTREGALVWLSWTSIPVPEHRLVFAVAKNITARRIQEEDRNLLLNELTERNRELKQLVSTVMHDLRSPASNIMTMFDLLGLEELVPQDCHEDIRMLRLCAENLRVTLDSYMELLIEKNNYNPAVSRLSLSDALLRTTGALRSLIHESNTSIKCDFSAEDLVWFNRTYLDSIFLNLITNSIKYSRMDAYPEIVISSSRKSGYVLLVFRDNGRGFDMEQVGNDIFNFNQRFHGHSDSKGVGLYLVRNHLTHFGGHISVESYRGVGTTFTIGFKELPK